MTKKIMQIIAVCAVCLACAARGQNSSTTGSSTDPSTQPGTSSSPDYSSRHFGATGRMGHQEVRASKLMGSEVKSSQGQALGTINDVIFNPASGRIDFAVLSLNSTGNESATGATTGTSTTPSTTTTGTSSTSTLAGSGKLVAVPWMLLRPSASAGYGTTTTTGTSTGEQQSFVFAGDSTKLQSAPSFEQSNWPDITQPSWRQSVFSHFGMTPGYSTGGSTAPGGTESSTGSSTTTPSTPPSSTEPDSSSQPKPQK